MISKRRGGRASLDLLCDALLLTLAKDPDRGRKRELVTRHSLRAARSQPRVLRVEDNGVNQHLAARTSCSASATGAVWR